MEGDGTQGNGHLVCKWWEPKSSADEGLGCGKEAKNLPRFIHSQEHHAGPTGSLNTDSSTS